MIDPANITRELLDAYRVRPCWLCGKAGPCEHREPLVELAYLHPEPARRPPARERKHFPDHERLREVMERSL